MQTIDYSPYAQTLLDNPASKTKPINIKFIAFTNPMLQSKPFEFGSKVS